jgi:pilus assembly protein Flp/PilA
MRAMLILRSVLRDTRGATAIEYGLIVSLIVIVIIGAMQSFGNASSGMWEDVRTKIQAVM